MKTCLPQLVSLFASVQDADTMTRRLNAASQLIEGRLAWHSSVRDVAWQDSHLSASDGQKTCKRWEK